MHAVACTAQRLEVSLNCPGVQEPGTEGVVRANPRLQIWVPLPHAVLLRAVRLTVPAFKVVLNLDVQVARVLGVGP